MLGVAILSALLIEGRLKVGNQFDENVDLVWTFARILRQEQVVDDGGFLETDCLYLLFQGVPVVTEHIQCLLRLYCLFCRVHCIP